MTYLKFCIICLSTDDTTCERAGCPKGIRNADSDWDGDGETHLNQEAMKKISLMGCPNVGKSVVFSRLIGVNVISSNYPWTTVDFTKGTTRIGSEKFELVDVPGTYSLEPTSKAEEVAQTMLEDVGYLPRLAVLVDTSLHKLGLHDSAIVPTILGFGCNAPDALATRIMETEKQRFIAATLMAITVSFSVGTIMRLILIGI